MNDLVLRDGITIGSFVTHAQVGRLLGVVIGMDDYGFYYVLWSTKPIARHNVQNLILLDCFSI